VSAGPAARPIPQLVGKTFDEAAAALRPLGVTTQRVDVFDDKIAAGRVTGISPAAGSQVRPGAAVTVNVSKGPDLVTVPALVGRTPPQAQQALTAAGLGVRATFGPPAGKVFSSEPASGAKVKRGTAVALYTK
jgi:serine/threonine-protein kinase